MQRPDDRAGKGNGLGHGFLWPGEVDEILKQGLTDGRAGKHAAVQKAQELYPQLTPAEIRGRLWKLENGSDRVLYQRAQWSPDDIEILREGYARGPEGARWATRELLRRHPDWTPRIIWYKAAALGLVRRSPQRIGRNGNGSHAWSRDAELVLEQDHGSEWTRDIGEKLGRSESAIRSKLWRQDLSSKFKDGLTRTDVVNELHISPRKLQWLIGTEQLKAGDLRIRRQSLKQFLERNSSPEIFHKGVLLGVMGRSPQDTLKSIEGSEKEAARSNAVSPGATSASKPSYTFGRAARLLQISREVVKQLVAAGVLKLSSVRIDEDAVRRFAKTHPSEINYGLVDPDVLEWWGMSRLGSSASDDAPAEKLPGRIKHVLTARTCPGCHGSFSGNGYSTHVNACADAAGLDITVLEWAAEHPAVRDSKNHKLRPVLGKEA